MTTAEMKEMIKTQAGFKLFCSMAQHLLAGKPIELVHISVDEEWLNTYEDLNTWEGCETEYDGVQDVEWDEDKQMWVHWGDEDREYTADDYENWKDHIREECLDFIAIVKDGGYNDDPHGFVITHELYNTACNFEVTSIETDKYTLTSDGGSKPAIHYKGRVPVFTSWGEAAGFLVIDTDTKEAAAGYSIY